MGSYWNREVSNFFALVFRESIACQLLSVWFTQRWGRLQNTFVYQQNIAVKFQSHDETFWEKTLSQNKRELQNSFGKMSLAYYSEEWLYMNNNKNLYWKAWSTKDKDQNKETEKPIVQKAK